MAKKSLAGRRREFKRWFQPVWKIGNWFTRFEGILAVFLGFVAAALYLLRDRLSVLGLVTGFGLVAISLQFCFRRGWATLFGPVFFYDVLRTTRRSNFALLRAVYAGALLLALFITYSSGLVRQGGTTFWDSLWNSGTIDYKKMQKVGESFFLLFSGVQWCAVLLFTPLCAAGAIAEEKERRTLPFLLASDLHEREIVLGKISGRMAYLVLFLLTGLPVLSLIQFLGGVDPNLVVASFVMSGMTMVSLASASVLMSVVFRKARTAVFFAFLLVLGFLLTSGCCGFLPLAWLTGGNPLVAVFRILDPRGGSSIGQTLPGVLAEYTACHLGITVFCYVLARVNLRGSNDPSLDSGPVIVEAPAAVARVKPVPPPRMLPPDEPMDVLPADQETKVLVVYPQVEPPVKARPPIGNDPILWKELYAEPLFRLGGGAQTLVYVLGMTGLLILAYALVLSLAAAVSGGTLAVFANWLARYAGTAVAFLMLMGVALRAAGTISSERERQTLDELLTTTVENREILWAKWLGSILGMRKWWLALGMIWGMSYIVGGITSLALPLLLVAWVVYAALIAGLGVLCSLFARSTLMATLATIIGFVIIGAAPWAGWTMFTALYYAGRSTPGDIDWIERFMVSGLTPPVTMGILAHRWEDFTGERSFLTWEHVRYALYGLGIHAALAGFLWYCLETYFAPITGRMPVGHARQRDAVKRAWAKSRPSKRPRSS